MLGPDLRVRSTGIRKDDFTGVRRTTNRDIHERNVTGPGGSGALRPALVWRENSGRACMWTHP
jgi:hypothetical protein